MHKHLCDNGILKPELVVGSMNTAKGSTISHTETTALYHQSPVRPRHLGLCVDRTPPLHPSVFRVQSAEQRNQNFGMPLALRGTHLGQMYESDIRLGSIPTV